MQATSFTLVQEEVAIAAASLKHSQDESGMILPVAFIIYKKSVVI